jgi:hypothetical protein
MCLIRCSGISVERDQRGDPIYLIDDSTGARLVDETTGLPLLADISGTIRFAGGYQTWLTRDRGWFKAVLTPGGSLVATTTANIRLPLETLRVTFDVLTASAGTLATSVAIQAQSPPFTLASGSFSASGAVTAGTQVIQYTSYNLADLTTLQAVATQMVADQQSKVTNFIDPFLAILWPGGPTQTTTMPVVRRRFAAARAFFDLLDQ